MAHKFVRGIDDIRSTQQDFSTSDVNDLLSDKNDNYIHRQKKNGEHEYHCLTDNIKTIKSDNTDLLTVTNNNKTSNSATLQPKHDAQKEQVIESERETFTIKHGLNGTPVTTKVDTNPQKVLEHTNLKGNTDYVKVTHSEGSETTTIDSSKTSTKFNELDKTIANKQDKLTPGYGISIENNVVKAPLFTRVVAGTDLNTIEYGFVRGDELLNAPDNGWYYIQSCSEGRNSMQIAWKLQLSTNQPKLEYRRDRVSGNWTEWVQTYPHNIEEVEVDNDLYSGYYLKNGNHLLQFKAAAKEGQYIDLSNFSFPTGVNPHHAYTLDVIFEHPSTSGATSASEAIALFTVGDDNKITINTQVVTSSLLVSNLTKVKAITLL